MKVLIITLDYPSKEEPYKATFVKNLAKSLKNLGHEIIILTTLRRGDRHEIEKDERLQVHRLSYQSYGAYEVPLLGSTLSWTGNSFFKAVARYLNEKEFHYDIIYGHFLYPAGWIILKLKEMIGTPCVVGVGESSFSFYEKHLGKDFIGSFKQSTALLSVSEENETFLKKHMNSLPETRVFPNACDENVFFPRDKEESREALGLPKKAKIVIFTGHLNERKGPHRVMEALQGLDDVKVIFLGDGPLRPKDDRIIKIGRVPHEEIPKWLSASDLFLLPTLAEGDSNAIWEALACGLPVLTSKIGANEKFADEINPCVLSLDSMKQWKDKIREIFESETLRQEMIQEGLSKARNNTLSKRGQRISQWFEDLIQAEKSRMKEGESSEE